MRATFGGLKTSRHRATTVNAAERSLDYDHTAYHWFLIGLRERAEIPSMRICTRWCTGNHVPAVSVLLREDLTGIEVQVLQRQPLGPDAEHELPIPPTAATECRVEIFSEGEISRVDLFGNKLV